MSESQEVVYEDSGQRVLHMFMLTGQRMTIQESAPEVTARLSSLETRGFFDERYDDGSWIRIYRHGIAYYTVNRPENIPDVNEAVEAAAADVSAGPGQKLLN